MAAGLVAARDLVAFTKQNKGRFHIGCDASDGAENVLLAASFPDEALMGRQTHGHHVAAKTQRQRSVSLYSVISSEDRHLKPVRDPRGSARDPVVVAAQK